ncbi:MAG TPA: response regulator transcription factor [Acidimicrobiales bacterium]
MSRVLVVDDEAPMVRALSTNLRARGYDVDLAVSGEQALRVAAKRHPDAVILDLSLPGIDGIDVLRELRGWTRVPIIIVSARRAEDDKVAALDAGADDFLAKPFGMGELLARLRAALRREVPDDGEARIVTDDFEVDLVEKRVTTVDGRDVHLTPTEWKVLEVLVRNSGKLVMGRRLLREVWGPDHGDESNALRVHLVHLRRKIEPDASHPRYVITEPGVGYRFEP